MVSRGIPSEKRYGLLPGDICRSVDLVCVSSGSLENIVN